ncbi:MAG: MaoC family dehydratase N-terminal domain-containing protein [Hyphomicrobiaceae bacterium]|nr:MaoC family dehydratase N-terminal domain-containing protein [Hyphomicrobiaceae bacterium]
MTETVANLSVLPGVLSIPAISISRDEMIAFARAFDPQPFHIDEAAAQHTLLGGLAASAWYTCARVSECVEAIARGLGLDAQLAGLEQIVLFAPVRAGDRLSGKLRLGAVGSCECGDGVCQGRIDVENQRGESIMRLTLDLVVMGPAGKSVETRQNCKFRQARPARAQRTARDDVIRHFEDIGIGDEAVLGSYSFDTRKVETFCSLTCMEGELRSPTFGGGQASVPNWHLPAAWMTCMLRYYEAESSRFAARGLAVPRLGPAAGVKHLRWVRPVRIGETIVFRGWAERKMEIASQKDWGLLVVGAEGVDSCGNVVVSFCPQMLIERAGYTS